jgi:2'-5' RNA ligase
MARLFVAIDLPQPVSATLACLPLPRLAGIRPISAAQMHLTLHFIGEGQVDAVLARLRARSFAFTIAGLGQFRGRNGGAILWAGIAPNDALAQLHQALGVALSASGMVPVGSQPQRPYLSHFRPHITLAKCTREVPTSCIASFIDQHADLILPEVRADRFVLYSSTTDSVGATYKIEGIFPLF